MAITVFTLDKPWIWVEKALGGTLPDNTTFYFIGWNGYSSNGYGPYYGYAPSKSSDQFVVTTDTVNKKIRMEIYEKGDIHHLFQMQVQVR